MAAVRLQVLQLEKRAERKIRRVQEEIMPMAKGLDHEAILEDRAAGMTHAALAEKYGAAKSTIAWHLRQNGNGDGETSHETAPDLAGDPGTIGRALADPEVQKLEQLVDQHWRLLGICDKVRALLSTYAG
jgi:hypothetical protein